MTCDQCRAPATTTTWFLVPFDTPVRGRAGIVASTKRCDQHPYQLSRALLMLREGRLFA